MAAKLFFTITVFALLGCHGSCFAWLGETEEEIRKQYGDPVFEDPHPPSSAPAEKELGFLYDDMQVIVTLYRGQSVSEGYKFEENITDALIPKIEKILKNDGRGLGWKRIENPAAFNAELTHGWVRMDRAVNAVVWRNSPDTLEVSDAAFNAEMMKERSR